MWASDLHVATFAGSLAPHKLLRDSYSRASLQMKPRRGVVPGWPPAQCTPEPVQPEVFPRAPRPGGTVGRPGAALGLREPAFHGDTQWGMAVCSHFSSSEENSVPPPGLPPQARRVVQHPEPVLVAPSPDNRDCFPP